MAGSGKVTVEYCPTSKMIADDSEFTRLVVRKT